MTRTFLRGIGPAIWRYALPLPPSLNGAYATVMRGKTPLRVPSAGLAKFKRDAARALLAQKRPADPLRGKVQITLRIERTRGDLDNRIKAILDALKDARVIADDRQVEQIDVAWCDVTEGAIATVEARG